MPKDYDIKYLPPETATERTERAIKEAGWTPNRINQAKAFLNRVSRNKKKRKVQKVARKRNR